MLRLKSGQNCKFMVLGLASRDFLRQSSETLAGRITYVRLTPFLWEEIEPDHPSEEYMVKGGFPRSLLTDFSRSERWREDFITTFLERDLLQWAGVSPFTMRRLWQMLAHNNGQTLNLSSLGSSLGVSFSTISGHPVFGSLWETLVLSTLSGELPSSDFFFYRTSQGAEIDFIIERKGKRIAIECKASLSPSLSRGNRYAIKDLQADHTLIVSPLEQGWNMKDGVKIVSLSQMISFLRELE